MNYIKLVSVYVFGMFVLSMFSFLMYIPNNSKAISLDDYDYPLTDKAVLWVRPNGSDPGFPYPNALVPPIYGMDYFGTKSVIAWTYNYTSSNLTDTNWWPEDCNIYRGFGAYSPAELADEALVDSRIKGVIWDDFPVGTINASYLQAIYNNYHHEDANLTQGALKMYLVVYNYNYFLQTPNNWSSISNYFDGIDFWFSPSGYGEMFTELSGYTNAFMELKSWLPTKEFRLGIYLHYYNAHDRPIAAENEQLGEACKLIKEGLATSLILFENFWIKNNPETSSFVRNYLLNEFLEDYITVISSTRDITSYDLNRNVIIPTIRNMIYDSHSGGFYIYSDHLQRVIIQNSHTIHSVYVQNVRTGQLMYTVISGSSVSFWATPHSEYKYYEKTYTSVYMEESLVIPLLINSPTVWSNKFITIKGELQINSTLRISDCIIQFLNDSHKKTSFNGTVPEYGIVFYKYANLYIDNSTIMAQNGMFPWKFSTIEYFGDLGNRTLIMHNTTLSNYAGMLKTYGHSYRFIDSVIYRPENDGNNWIGLQPYAGLMDNNDLIIKNVIFESATGNGIVLNVPYYFGIECKIKNLYIVGGNNSIMAAAFYGMNKNLLYDNVIISHFQDYTKSSCYGGWIPISNADNTGGYYVNLTNTIAIKGNNLNVFGGTLKDKNDVTIGTFSTTNGTVYLNGLWAYWYNATTVIEHPYPWTFTVTSGLDYSNNKYYVQDYGWHDSFDSTMFYPSVTSFNNSKIVLHQGNFNEYTIYNVSAGFTLNGKESYFFTDGRVSLNNQSYWRSSNYSYDMCKLSAVSSVTVTINTIKNKNYNITFTATSTSDTDFTIYNLEYGTYKLYVDNVYSNTYHSREGNHGIIQFSHSMSTHTFTLLKINDDSNLGNNTAYTILLLFIGIILVVLFISLFITDYKKEDITLNSAIMYIITVVIALFMVVILAAIITS